MTRHVTIADVAALDRLRAELAQFRDEIDAALNAASARVQVALTQVGERVRYWQRQYEAWQGEASRRLATYQRCLASADQDHGCSSEYEAWAEAARFAAAAAGNLKEANRQFDGLKQAAEAFENEKRSVRATFEAGVADATSTLMQVAARARIVHAAPIAASVFARSGTIFAAPGRAPPTAARQAGAGLHSPNGREGQGVEGPPAPEAGEGPARQPVEADRDLTPPRGIGREGPGSPERGW